MVDSVLPLRLKDVVVAKRGKTIVGPVNLEIEDGGTTIVMGPNGAGKTTLLRLMHGLERPRSGSVEWNCDTSASRECQAFVFQSPIMLRRPVIENIVYSLKLKNVPAPEAYSTSRKWLEKVGLEARAELPAAFLSGGEKQKLALARALAGTPQILFLDEPTANLDGTSTREIETIILDAVNAGIRIVMTTHDTGQASRLADEILFMYRGKLHERGTARDFFAKPKTSESISFLNGEIVE